MIVSGLSYPAVHRRPVQVWDEHRPDLNTSAMQIVAQINAITDTGFAPVDIGGLDDSSHLEPGGVLFPRMYYPTDLQIAVGLK